MKPVETCNKYKSKNRNMLTATENIIPVYNTQKIKALNKFLFVTPITEHEKSASGLAMSSSDMNEIRYRKAKVFSVGALVTPDTVKDGDMILYDRHAGYTMMLNGVTYTVIKEGDVIACLPVL